MNSSWIYRRQNYLPVERDAECIGSQVVSGSLWSGVEVGATTLLQFVRSIIFARLLMPADFGVLSLATVFTEFILIFANFGFTASIIYQKELDKQDLSTSWWGNIFVDFSAALVCLIFAFFSSRFTEDRTTIYIICLLAVQFVILSIGSVSMAMMRRQFMFKQLALIKIASTIVSFFVALFLITIFDFGVYGLVCGLISGNLILTGCYFANLPWLPSFSFSLNRLRKHLHYGGWFLGVNVVTYVNENMDKALVGTYLNTTQLGFYEYAANIPLMVASKLSQVLNSVLFPAFSSLQDDLKQLGDLLKRVYRYNALLIYPILTGIALVAPDFVLAAYGEKWRPIIEPLRLFCLFGVVRIFINPSYALCNGIGKPQLPFRWILIYLPINALLMFCGVKYFGVLGAVEARLMLPIFMSFTMGWQILKLIKLSYYEVARSVFPALLCCTVMSAVVLLVGYAISPIVALPLFRLLILIPVGVLSYVGSLRLFFRSDFVYVVDKLRRR